MSAFDKSLLLIAFLPAVPVLYLAIVAGIRWVHVSFTREEEVADVAENRARH